MKDIWSIQLSHTYIHYSLIYTIANAMQGSEACLIKNGVREEDGESARIRT